MQRQLGEIPMVRWQGRRLAGHVRAKSRLVRTILLLAVLSIVSLAVGFYGGLPIPIGLLQGTAVVLIAAVTAYAAWSVILAMFHRDGADRR